MPKYYDMYKEDYDYYQMGGVTCTPDNEYLVIKDGDSEGSPLIGAYCGNSTTLSLPISIQSTQNNVWMR